MYVNTLFQWKIINQYYIGRHKDRVWLHQHKAPDFQPYYAITNSISIVPVYGHVKIE